MHIGREIEKRFQDSGLKITVFADKINTGERNVYSIFKREDISADMLRKISEVLNYNFFELYLNELDSKLVKDPNAHYATKSNNITVTLTLTGSLATYGNFPDLLTKVRNEARELGFEIN